jgi:hypothetical protein
MVVSYKSVNINSKVSSEITKKEAWKYLPFASFHLKNVQWGLSQETARSNYNTKGCEKKEILK